MRFSCDKCSTKYTVSDEKVRGRVVAVRCTRCGNRITVNGRALLAAALPEDETRVATLDLEALRASIRGLPAPDEVQPSAPAPEPSAPDEAPLVAAAPLLDGWYVIIAGVQHGPVPAPELRAHVGSGWVGPRTYVWRDGQGDWKRASEVPEFAALLPAEPPKGAEAPAPSSASAPIADGAADPRAAPKNGTTALERPAEMPEALLPDLDSGAGAASAEGALAASATAAESWSAGTPEGQAPPSAALDRLLFEGEGVSSPANPVGRPIDVAGVAVGELERNASSQNADPFAKVPDSPGLAKPGEIGEQTRFFINQSGVNRRNPWWKIALAVVGAPVAVVAALYGLTQMRIVHLEITRVDEATGAEVKRSVFSSEGMSGLKEILLGANKKKAPAPRKLQGSAAVVQNERRTGASSGRADNNDDPRIQRPRIDFGGPMNDIQRERAAEIYKGGGVLSLEGPKVRADRLQDKQAVDGKAAVEPSVIADVIGKHAKAFQACVENELRRNPGFKGGKVLITASLKPSGIVGGASINRPEIDASSVGVCLKEKARRMVFPSFEGDPFDVEIPLVLTAGE